MTRHQLTWSGSVDGPCLRLDISWELFYFNFQENWAQNLSEPQLPDLT